jgi:hypothetical protein
MCRWQQYDGNMSYIFPEYLFIFTYLFIPLSSKQVQHRLPDVDPKMYYIANKCHYLARNLMW